MRSSPLEGIAAFVHCAPGLDKKKFNSTVMLRKSGKAQLSKVILGATNETCQELQLILPGQLFPTPPPIPSSDNINLSVITFSTSIGREDTTFPPWNLTTAFHFSSKNRSQVSFGPQHDRLNSR